MTPGNDTALPEREVWTAREAAAAMGLDEDTFRDRCAAGQIPGARQPGGPRTAWLVHIATFRAWWAEPHQALPAAPRQRPRRRSR